MEASRASPSSETWVFRPLGTEAGRPSLAGISWSRTVRPGTPSAGGRMRQMTLSFSTLLNSVIEV